MVKHASPAPGLLPFALWDHILPYLPNLALLHVSAVCRALNKRCIDLLRRRTQLLRSVKDDGRVEAWSSSSGITHLRCKLPAIVDLADLEELHNLVRRSKALVELDCTVPYASRYRQGEVTVDAQRALQTSFCKMLSTVVGRGDDSLVVFYNGVLFTCQPRDIRGWSTDTQKSRRRSGLSEKLRLIPSDKPQRPSFTQLPSVFIHLYGLDLSRSSPYPSSTIMLLESPYTLTLDTTCVYGTALSTPALAFLLSEMTFPSLTYLELRRTDVSPTVLRAFLERHPGLASIALTAPDPVNDSESSDSRPLLSQPIAHPGLRALRASTLPHMLCLLASLARSPNLESFAFPFTSSSSSAPTPTDVLQLIAALSAPSSSPPPLHLHLDFPPDFPPIEIDTDLLEITQALHRVAFVTLASFATFDDARAMIPWLACLPALTHLRFGVCTISTSRAERTRLVADAREALPYVHVEDSVE